MCNLNKLVNLLQIPHTDLALFSKQRYSRGSAALALVVFTPLSMNSPAYKNNKTTISLQHKNPFFDTAFNY